MTAPLLVTRDALLAVIREERKPRPMCRDCADMRTDRCQDDPNGRLCDPDEALAEALMRVVRDPATLADDKALVTAAAAAIYDGGDEQEWLNTADDSPNAASWWYAQQAYNALAAALTEDGAA